MLTVIAEKENIDENNGKILIKDKSDCNHIQNVYRLNMGDELRIIDGEYEYFTKINEKKEKWDVVVRETLKQCRGIKFTEITPVKKLEEIDYSKYDKIIFAYENSDESKSLPEIIKKEDKNILYIIGPEGGITQEEVNFLKENKAIEISLGKRILRAETAAIVVCGIIANFYI